RARIEKASARRRTHARKHPGNFDDAGIEPVTISFGQWSILGESVEQRIVVDGFRQALLSIFVVALAPRPAVRIQVRRESFSLDDFPRRFTDRAFNARGDCKNRRHPVSRSVSRYWRAR